MRCMLCWRSRCTQATWMPWPLCDMEGPDLFINASHFGQCCTQRKLKQHVLKPTPIVLDDCLAKRRPEYSHLLRHILSYDAAFQMASSGVHRDIEDSGEHPVVTKALSVRLCQSRITWVVKYRCWRSDCRQRTVGSPSAFLVTGDIHHYIGLAEQWPNEKLGYLELCDTEHEVYNGSISQPDLTLDTDIMSSRGWDIDSENQEP